MMHQIYSMLSAVVLWIQLQVSVDYLLYHFPHKDVYGEETKRIQTQHTLSNQNTNYTTGQKQRHSVLFLGHSTDNQPDCNPLLH